MGEKRSNYQELLDLKNFRAESEEPSEEQK